MSLFNTRNAACGIAVAAACFSGPVAAESFIVVANQQLDRAEAAVRNAGGSITARIPEIGVLIAESEGADFRDRIGQAKGVHGVAANINLRMLQPDQAALVSEAANPPFTFDDDFFFDLQWGHTAIQATDAWAAGYRGNGVRVAVLDSGIDPSHPDLAPNLNTTLSTSFVPGETFDVQPGFYFNHGTHVAGTIAAADNAYGTIGVAPEAEIVAVKVLSEFTGSGSFGGIMQGIVYAAIIEADVINMSLGATIPRNCTFDVLDDDGNPTGETQHFPASDCNLLLTATGRATNFAKQQGVTIIASAGNDGRDRNHDGALFELPNDLPGVYAISATAPIGWAKDPANSHLDNLASYSNFGQAGVDLAAPGGDFIYPGNDVCGLVVVQFCWVFDMVFSTIPGGWSWSAGTSMAAPHASGVAALIIGKNGGSMHPSQVMAAMRAGAEDLGKPGKDAAYGAGRVNALNSVLD